MVTTVKPPGHVNDISAEYPLPILLIFLWGIGFICSITFKSIHYFNLRFFTQYLVALLSALAFGDFAFYVYKGYTTKPLFNVFDEFFADMSPALMSADAFAICTYWDE